MKTFEQLVSEKFSIPVEEVRDELSSKDIPDWDSMNYLLFIADVEKEFNVSFSMDEVLGASTLGSIREALRAKGVEV
jgi:acyl carrier protein